MPHRIRIAAELLRSSASNNATFADELIDCANQLMALSHRVQDSQGLPNPTLRSSIPVISRLIIGLAADFDAEIREAANKPFVPPAPCCAAE